MRTKRHLLLFVAIIASMAASFADSLNEEQARYAAASFFAPTEQRARLNAKGRQMILRSNGHENGFYIFDRPEGGCVFVADDDAIGRTVLGYTDQGFYDDQNIPVGLQDWLSQIKVLMDAVHEGKIDRQPTDRMVRKVIVKKLIKTTWNQYEPYNNLCPKLGMERCITGCVATAMAQVMKYWEWPEHGYGSITYHDMGCGQTLSRDFTKSTYDWGNMLDTYQGVPYMREAANAVATLMRDCGYAVQMHYTPESSGASVSAEEMARYFHYSTAAIDRYSDNYPEEAWHELIRQDLEAKRPILYSGASDETGHEFILDGYDTGNYYHVNWGWGGYQDGWFTLTNLNGFNNGQSMINGLEPEYNDESDYTYFLNEEGVLTISGTGMMPKEYRLSTAPWAERCQTVRKIVFDEGIAGIIDGFSYADGTENKYSNLEEIVLPEGLQYIGTYAFLFPNFTSVTLPSTLIETNEAFYGAPLESIHLPKSMISFNEYLPYLKELTVDTENPWLCAVDNILYDKKGSTLFFIPRGLDCITIAETTSKIKSVYLFSMGKPIICKCLKFPSLNSVYIDYPSNYIRNSGIFFLPEGADYESWEQILPSDWNIYTYMDDNYIPDTKIKWTLNDGVLTISGWCKQGEDYSYVAAPYYQSADQVQKLVVVEGVTSLAWAGYYGYSNLTELVLPSTLTEIGEYCFVFTGLNTITCSAMKAPALVNKNKTFYGIAKEGTLRIPEGADDASYRSEWGLPETWKIEHFTPEPMATYALSGGEQKGVENLKDWNALLKQHPNAVGMIHPRYHDWAYLTHNMLFEKDAEQGQYHCVSLQLADANDFTAPVPFTVFKGTYSRKLQAGYNAVCLPFSIHQADLPKGCRMYVVSHYDTDKNEVVLLTTRKTSPGEACLIYCNAEADWQMEFTQNIANQPQTMAENMMRGTFRSTNEYMTTGYVPNANGTTLVPLREQLNPFRACILLTNATAPNEVNIRIAEKDEADAINSIMADSTADIYTLDGRRLSAPIKGQPYIQNRKKKIIR